MGAIIQFIFVMLIGYAVFGYILATEIFMKLPEIYGEVPWWGWVITASFVTYCGITGPEPTD